MSSDGCHPFSHAIPYQRSEMKHLSLQRSLPNWYLVLASLLLVFGAGCRSSRDGSTTLTVFAAASLTEAFADLAEAYERQHTGVDVQLNFAGSQQLAQQLAQGAPADLFASANQRQMTVAVAAGRVEATAPQLFASNRLVIVAPADNPAGIGTLADLARPDVKLVLAAAPVPAGQYARQILAQVETDPRFDSAGSASFQEAVLANVVSYEQNVRAVLTKVALGEADAGIVYASDVQGSTVTAIEIGAADNVLALYPLAPTADSVHPELAQAFAHFVLSAEGQRILAAHGLQPPPES